MSEKILQTVCIRCPVGCHLTVKKVGDEVVVEGNSCPRGSQYGRQEFINPMRTITAVYRLKNGGTLTVRTDRAVEKIKYFTVLDAIHSAPEPAELVVGGVLIANVCNTRANVIITSVNRPE